MTTGKTIALTRRTFVGKVMSLLSNMLSRLVIAFLPRSKHLFNSWLQSPSAVILKPPKIKSATVSTVSPSICHEVMGPDAMIFVFWMLSFKPTFSLSSFSFIMSLVEPKYLPWGRDGSQKILGVPSWALLLCTWWGSIGFFSASSPGLRFAKCFHFVASFRQASQRSEFL